MIEDAPEIPRLRRDPVLASRWLWLGLLGAVLVVSLLLPGNPRALGLFYDDATYWSLGRSLVEEGVYRDLHSPDPIQIAKYPPGVPLLTGLAQVVSGGDVTAGVSILRVLYALVLVLTLSLYLSLLRTEGGALSRAGPLLVAAVAFNPLLLDLLQAPLSEIPALLLVMAALVRISRPSPGVGWREAAVLAALCLGAVAMRTMAGLVGITVLLVLLGSGRKGLAGRFALLWIPAVLLLQGWLAMMSRPAEGFEDITVYGLPYGGLLVDGLSHVARVAAVNALQTVLFVAGLCFPGLLPAGYPQDEQFPVLWWGVSAAVLCLVLLGWFLRRRSREPGDELSVTAFRLRPHQVFLLLNLVVILVWPFESLRFWLFLLPFLYIEVARGGSVFHRRWGAVAVAAFGLLLALNQTVPDRLVRTADAYPLGASTLDVASALKDLEQVEPLLPEWAVVASTRDTFLDAHLRVRGVDGWSNAQLVEKQYGSERTWRTFYMTAHPYTLVANLFTRLESVLEEYRRLEVSHVVLMQSIGDPLQGSLLASVVNQLNKEGRATLLYQSDSGTSVWEIVP